MSDAYQVSDYADRDVPFSTPKEVFRYCDRPPPKMLRCNALVSWARCDNVYGTKKWYCHGVLHREDGPAVEPSGTTDKWVRSWFIHGKEVTQEEHEVLFPPGQPRGLSCPHAVGPQGPQGSVGIDPS